MTETSPPFWEQDAAKGWKREIFELFDSEGEGVVLRRLATYAEPYRTHADIWLKRAAEARAAEEARRRAEEVDLQRRAVAAAERSADEARKARNAAWAAVAVAIVAVGISILTWAFG